jgi:hypothetical protein
MVGISSSSSKIAGYGLDYWLWLPSAFISVCGAFQALMLPSKVAHMANQSTDPSPSSGTPHVTQEPRQG